MGFEGLAELQRFAEEGGTIVTLGNSTRLAGGTGLARTLSEQTTRTLFHPGSVVRARARQAKSPILYGYPETFTIFRGNGPLFSVATRDSSMVVLQYGTRRPEPTRDEGEMLGIPATPAAATNAERPAGAQGDAPTTAGATTAGGPAGTNQPTQAAAAAAGTTPAGAAQAGAAQATPAQGATPGGAQGARAAGAADENAYVVSGMVRGQDEIVGQGAIFDIPLRQGRVIAFTFDPLHRFLNHHEFPLVWNALMHWNDRTGAAAVSADR